MATIKVTAYLNEVKDIKGSTLFKVGERHARKNDATGEWEQNGDNSYFDVWTSRAEINPAAFEIGDLIVIEGSYRSTKVETEEGKTYFNHVINATSVKKFEKRETYPDGVRKEADSWGSATEADVPF